MSNIAFDTLEFTETLKAAGVPDAQARAEVKAIGAAFGQVLNAQVATKEDLHEVKVELKDDISEVKAELKDDISEVKAELKDDIHGLKEEIIKLDNKIDTVAQETRAEIRLIDMRLSGKINLIHWMLAVNLGFTMVMFWKLFNL